MTTFLVQLNISKIKFQTYRLSILLPVIPVTTFVQAISRGQTSHNLVPLKYIHDIDEHRYVNVHIHTYTRCFSSLEPYRIRGGGPLKALPPNFCPHAFHFGATLIVC